MNTAYFFSGFDSPAGFTDKISDHMRKDITNRDALLFIASSPAGHEKSDRYLNINKKWFDRIGIFFKEYCLLDNRVGRTRALELINAASCIFLMGGDTLAQFAFIKNHELINAVRDSKAVIIGISAGAINMAKTSLCSKHNHGSETFVYDGIGISDITVEPHFSPANTELISELKLVSPHHAIYALCDNSAIIMRGASITYIGEIYQIHKGRMKQVSS